MENLKEKSIWQFTVNKKYTFHIISTCEGLAKDAAKSYYLSHNQLIEKEIKSMVSIKLIDLSKVVNL